MKKYKSFFILTLLTSAFFTFFSFLISDFIIKNNNGIFFKEDDLNILLWLDKKEQINNTLNKGDDTIIILGGSSVLFGTNSDIISEITGKNVINLGTHAGVKDYIFIWAKKVLKKGNIVILPIEFGSVLDYGKICDYKANYIISNDKETYKNFNLSTKTKYIGYFLTHSAICYNKKVKNKKLEEKRKQAYFRNDFEKMFSQNFWNEKGDVVINLGQNKEGIKKAKMQDCPKAEKIKLSEDFLSFIKWCNNNGIKVYVTYPPIFPYKDLNSKTSQDFLRDYKKVFKHNNIDFIGEAQDSFLDVKYFLDGNYHLNQEGQRKRSIYLGNLIKAHLPQ